MNCQSCGIQMARPQRERDIQALWKSCHGIMCPDSGVWPQVWVFTVLHFYLALVSSIHYIPPSLPFEILALCRFIWGHGACFDFTAKHSWHVPWVLEDLKFGLRGHIEYEDLGGLQKFSLHYEMFVNLWRRTRDRMLYFEYEMSPTGSCVECWAYSREGSANFRRQSQVTGAIP